MRTREQKQTEVEALRERLARANSVLLADYRGLSVPEANDLRARLRKAGAGGIEYRVAKNTLVRIAIRGTSTEALEPFVQGPTALAISYDEPSILAKTLVDYAKQNEKLEIRAGVIEGEVVDPDAIRRLAALPGRDELRAMLMSTLRAPMQNLASGLYALLGNVRNALEQRQRQLET